MEKHLGAWASEFADNVERNAETKFYKNLASATRLFVTKNLREDLKISIRKLYYSKRSDLAPENVEVAPGTQ
jgi:TorA maturation chaperone TorD